MTIDELGRAAASEARRNAVTAIDPATMLDRLHQLRRRRRTARLVAATVCVAATLAVAGALVNRTDSAKHKNPASGRSTASSRPCADPEIKCIGANRLRFIGLPAPITVNPPANFHRQFTVETDAIEAYRNDVATTGVAVTENATPVKYGPTAWVRDPNAGSTAASMARWLSHRPFLVHTALTRTTVGGLPAWQVSGDLKPNAALPASKVGGDVAPTFGHSYNEGFGYRADLTGQYTLLDVPKAGVTVIWSWTLNHDASALTQNQAFIDGLSFG